MAIKTTRWNAAELLETREDAAAYIAAAMEDGDPQLIAAAIGDVAKAMGMSKLAKQTGLSRESLYRSLSCDGNPEFATVVRVLNALGIRLEPKATDEPDRENEIA